LDHDKKEKKDNRESEMEVARLQTSNKQPIDPTFAIITPKNLALDPFILEHYSSEGNVEQKPDAFFFSSNNNNIMKKSLGNKLKYHYFWRIRKKTPGK